MDLHVALVGERLIAEVTPKTITHTVLTLCSVDQTIKDDTGKGVRQYEDGYERTATTRRRSVSRRTCTRSRFACVADHPRTARLDRWSTCAWPHEQSVEISTGAR